MSALTDFLLARVAEEVETAGHMAPGWHRRRLIECEAKRRIVEVMSLPDTVIEPTAIGVAEIARRAVLGNLALPYADHPDYQEEWRP